MLERWYKMNITDVRLRKVGEEGKLKAIASVTFDDEFVVHDIKVIDGQNGLFIAMPSRKIGNGEFRDVAHPLSSETRNKIRDAIFEEYEKAPAPEAPLSRAELPHILRPCRRKQANRLCAPLPGSGKQGHPHSEDSRP